MNYHDEEFSRDLWASIFQVQLPDNLDVAQLEQIVYTRVHNMNITIYQGCL